MRNEETTRRRQRRGGLALAVFGCALGLAYLPGCTSMVGEKKKPADPILGEVHPQNSAPYGPVPPPPKSSETTGHKMSANTPSDPLVGPSPNSPAYLASISKPFPGSKGLAITDGAQQVENSMPPARPVPRDPAFVNGSWAQAPGAPGAGSGTSTPGPFNGQPGNFVDPQGEILKARGITQFRFDSQPDGKVRLIAFGPPPPDSSPPRTFDVTANDSPAAVQALIQQLELVK